MSEAIYILQLPLSYMAFNFLSFLSTQQRICGNKIELVCLLCYARGLSGSGMTCNLPLKVVDFVDLWFFLCCFIGFYVSNSSLW